MQAASPGGFLLSLVSDAAAAAAAVLSLVAGLLVQGALRSPGSNALRSGASAVETGSAFLSISTDSCHVALCQQHREGRLVMVRG